MDKLESRISGDSERALTDDAGPEPVPWAPSRGVLRLSRFGEGVPSECPTLHRSTVVNGPEYSGMADNDIRGFLDGGFIWGWNQATQIHIRLGRSAKYPKPRYGEAELFRVLQRWDAISLPPGFELHACRMTLHVEEGPARPLRLLIYAVARDWNPGSGGVHGNNVSTPNPGEVWWGEAEYGSAAWGLPGAGFASDSHAGADTGSQALAEATWIPGQDSLFFRSAAFAAYVAGQIRHGQPILLLLKLTDAQEDTPGCFLNLYSGEHGDSRNTVRRPQLELEWTCEGEAESVAHDVLLEYGRVCEFSRQDSGGGIWAAHFETDPGYTRPCIQVREGTGDTVGPWRTMTHPFRPEAEWLQLRALAMPDPVQLGDSFEAELTDTWILTAPPERQSVRWIFQSPTGSVHTVQAEYCGRYRWSVRFTPDEPGTWRYHWTQEFLPEPYRSADGEFHVRGESLDAVLYSLTRLEGIVAETPGRDHPKLYLRLYALEREGMRLLGPEYSGGTAGQELTSALRRVRSRLWGRPVPDPIPLQSHVLVREVDGVPFADPIPDRSNYEPAGKNRRGGKRGNRGILSRFRTRLGRLVGPRHDSSS